MRIGPHDLDSRVLIVAEIGNNHEGDFARAEAMIQAAAEAGADVAKFQTIVPTRLTSAREKARIELLSRFQFTPDQFRRLAETAAAAGLLFVSTPFDIGSAEMLAPFVPAFKIASGDNDFFPLLSAVARTGKPVLLSTGLLDLAGVARAKAHLEAEWQRAGVQGEIALLHCVVAYPTPDDQANLGAIRDLARLGATVGYSDHTPGIEAAVLSVALGARVVEKHFTLDRDLSDFRDHKLSADPRDFAEMVRRIRLAEAMLGPGVKRPMPAEEPNAPAVRRSIAAARTLEAGTVIAPGDLTWVRPRRGLAPGHEDELIGRRLAVQVEDGDVVLPEHLAGA